MVKTIFSADVINFLSADTNNLLFPIIDSGFLFTAAGGDFLSSVADSSFLSAIASGSSLFLVANGSFLFAACHDGFLSIAATGKFLSFVISSYFLFPVASYSFLSFVIIGDAFLTNTSLLLSQLATLSYVTYYFWAFLPVLAACFATLYTKKKNV